MRKNALKNTDQSSLFPSTLNVIHKKENNPPLALPEHTKHSPKMTILPKNSLTPEELDELYKKTPEEPWWNQ